MASQDMETSRKNILIVFAHCDRKASFNGAMLEKAVTVLEGRGHKVTVSDLHGMSFNPVISESDMVDGPVDKTKLSYQHEMGEAWKRGTVVKEITSELEKWDKADLIIFQFPIFWGGLPAILKGYFDRLYIYEAVFTHQMNFNKGKYVGKKALVSVTTGGNASVYTDTGMLGNIDVILYPFLNITLRYVGFDLLPVNVIHDVHPPPRDALGESLRKWASRLEHVFEETPIMLPTSTPFLTPRSSEEGKDSTESHTYKSIFAYETSSDKL